MTVTAPADAVDAPRVAVVSSAWARASQGERAVAVRSISGALSRLAAVDVFVPGDGPPFGDGAFDVTPIGDGRLPRASYKAVLLETCPGDPDALLEPAASLSAGAPVLSVGAAATRVDGVLDVRLDEPSDGSGDGGRPVLHHVGLYARVHPDAGSRRHYGLGEAPGYLLVLGDRRADAPAPSPSPSERALWLLARFPRELVVVIEGGVARAWRSRSCVAHFGVHTRMDLWILMAQAWGVVDLLPGDVYARECVEALRFGVPIVVPSGSAADRLARAAGGMRFSSTAELLSCVEALGDPATRTTLGSAGRKVADRWYGDPQALVARLARALSLAVSLPTTVPAEGTRARSPSPPR